MQSVICGLQSVVCKCQTPRNFGTRRASATRIAVLVGSSLFCSFFCCHAILNGIFSSVMCDICREVVWSITMKTRQAHQLVSLQIQLFGRASSCVRHHFPAQISLK